MKLRPFSYLLIVVAAIVLVSLVGVGWARRGGPSRPVMMTSLMVQARHPPNQAGINGASPPTPQVVMGTPEAYVPPAAPGRYTYRNEFPADRSKMRPLYLIDTQTGQETRLGDGSDVAFFSVMDDQHLVWYFAGFHAYHLATGQDTLLSKVGSPSIHPQLFGDWLAFGNYNGGGTKLATLYAANVQTQEIITLTQIMPARDASVSDIFGISDRLAAWYEARNTIVIYDLTTRREITRLTNINAVFNERYLDVLGLSPGETVVTWSLNYGYDLVTRSYFRLGDLRPPGWDNAPIATTSRIQERDRILSWTFTMRDGTQRHVRAPLLDATPSVAPCVDGQNLVQNSDLEDIAAHSVWQQRGNPSDLIVNELPPNSPQAGQWAIRLGRYNNTQSAVQQTLNIPSGVKQISLAFDVRANSWDIWGGDHLQVDLIDPVTNQSILTTPLQWTNVQLNTGNWVPMQVTIKGWPGIDTPLQLVFRATTDWAFPTDFTIDNIRFITSCQ